MSCFWQPQQGAKLNSVSSSCQNTSKSFTTSFFISLLRLVAKHLFDCLKGCSWINSKSPHPIDRLTIPNHNQLSTRIFTSDSHFWQRRQHFIRRVQHNSNISTCPKYVITKFLHLRNKTKPPALFARRWSTKPGASYPGVQNKNTGRCGAITTHSSSGCTTNHFKGQKKNQKKNKPATFAILQQACDACFLPTPLLSNRPNLPLSNSPQIQSYSPTKPDNIFWVRMKRRKHKKNLPYSSCVPWK